jgi:DNA-binding MarR family transcriptional regulator
MLRDSIRTMGRNLRASPRAYKPVATKAGKAATELATGLPEGFASPLALARLRTRCICTHYTGMDTTASGCTCFLLRRAARRVSQRYDRALAPLGLSLNEYAILRRAGEPVAMGALAELMGMDRSTLSRNLRPLLAAGWVEERRDGDARRKPVAITSAGRQLLRRAEPVWRQAQQQLQEIVGDAAVGRLHRELQQLDQALHATGAEP